MLQVIRPADTKAFAGSRIFGTAIRERISALLKDEGEVICDLAGVTGMTPSFADECFGRLSEDSGFDIIAGKVHLEHAEQFMPLIEGVIRLRLQHRSAKD